jgi:hypothetical protein
MSDGEQDRALSLLGELRQDHQQIQRSKTKQIDVPGYRGRLVAEYRVIPWDDEQEIEQKAVKGGFHTRKQLNSWIAQLIAGCVQLTAPRPKLTRIF